MSQASILETVPAKNIKIVSTNPESGEYLEYLRKNVPHIANSEFIKIINVFAHNFRVNYYQYFQSTDNIMKTPRIIESYFLEVIKTATGFDLMNRTLEQRAQKKENRLRNLI